MLFSDRRKTGRYDLYLPALLQFDKGQEPVECLTRDVSSAGAFFYAKQSKPVGSAVKVELILPNHVQIKVDGSVIRSTVRGMAVCFNSGYKIITEKN